MASLLLVAMPFAPSSVLLFLVAMAFAPSIASSFLVAMPGTPNSVLAPSSDALCS